MAGYIGRTVPVATSGTEHKKVFTATSGQTSFTGLSYTPTKVHVFQNGVRLVDGTDYTASNGTSITLTVGATTDDQIVVVSYATFQPSDTISASLGGTFLSGVTFEDSATFENTASFNVSGTPFVANRIGSTGTILDFQKDGVDIGTMGTVGGKFYIGSLSGNDAFLKFESDILSPSDNAGVARNNAIDLGKSVSAFKDLYLGGGVHLGGTGAANKMDDYEDGTYTPLMQIGGSTSGIVQSSQNGTYTKVGKLVCVTFRINLSSKGSNTGGITFSLPFTARAISGFQGGMGIASYISNFSSVTNNSLGLTASQGGAVIDAFQVTTGSSITNTNISDNSQIAASITYYTD